MVVGGERAAGVVMEEKVSFVSRLRVRWGWKVSLIDGMGQD